MGKKGTPHRKWSKKEKLRFIRLHLDEHISIKEIEKKYGVRHSLVSTWVKRYLEDGEEALEPKNGNPYAALHTSKSLSEVDRLRLIIAKQEVEIARLKKGIGWKELVQTRIRYWQRKDYEIIEEMREKYPVDFLCRLMNANRSGYYKWRQRKGTLNRYEQNRIVLTELLRTAHEKHPSHGYHRLALDVFSETDGCFLTTWLTSAVKPRESAQKPENAFISVLVRKASSLLMRSKDAGTRPSRSSLSFPI